MNVLCLNLELSIGSSASSEMERARSVFSQQQTKISLETVFDGVRTSERRKRVLNAVFNGLMDPR